MQNDRGQFRCYRYCFIVERYRRRTPIRRKRAADNLRFPLSRHSFSNFSSYVRVEKAFRFEPRKIRNITYRQCGGLRDVLSSTVRSSSILQISSSVADLADKYSIPSSPLPEISSVLHLHFDSSLHSHR